MMIDNRSKTEHTKKITTPASAAGRSLAAVNTIIRDYHDGVTTISVCEIVKRPWPFGWRVSWRGREHIINDDPPLIGGRAVSIYQCDRCGKIVMRPRSTLHWPKRSPKCGGKWIER